MKVISEGNNNVTNLLGHQCIRKNERYRKMHYLLSKMCKDGLLLHNVITGKLILLDEQEIEIISKLPNIPNEDLNGMIMDYFLVPEGYDEKKLVDNLRAVMRKVYDPKGINGYTILTTTKCNARCFYCYENNMRRIDMSESTADKLVEYMSKHKGEGMIRLRWFGGEPLIGIARIDQICAGLRKKGISFSSTMISNGYLFNEDVVKRARDEWQLTTVQITLDGTEQVYNKVKAYVKAEENPYQRVLHNIQVLTENDIRVTIRLNVDQHNAENLSELIHELSEKFPERRNLHVYVHEVFKNVGFSPVTHNEHEDRIIFDTKEKLEEELRRVGLAEKDFRLPFLKIRNCMADSKGTIVIHPSGETYKCEHIMEYDRIGSIENEQMDEEIIRNFERINEMDFCRECPMYPNCVVLNHCPNMNDFAYFKCEKFISTLPERLEYAWERFKDQKRT